MNPAISERFWIIRPADGLRLALSVRSGGEPPVGDAVSLEMLDSRGGTICTADLLLQIGQPVTLCLAGGGSLQGSVRWVADDRAGILWNYALPTAAVRTLRMKHTGFLRGVRDLDLTARRSVV